MSTWIAGSSFFGSTRTTMPCEFSISAIFDFSALRLGRLDHRGRHDVQDLGQFLVQASKRKRRNSSVLWLAPAETISPPVTAILLALVGISKVFAGAGGAAMKMEHFHTTGLKCFSTGLYPQICSQLQGSSPLSLSFKDNPGIFGPAKASACLVSKIALISASASAGNLVGARCSCLGKCLADAYHLTSTKVLVYGNKRQCLLRPSIQDQSRA